MPSQASGDSATTLGRNIRIARDAANLTQRELAAKLDTDPVLISKWERGVHRPSEENLQALSEKLGRTLGWLYTDHDNESVAA